MSFARIRIALVVVVTASIALFTGLASPQGATAIGNASLYWIYSDGGAGNRIVKAAEAATLNPMAITPATASGYTYRTLATDGTYLYFTDNSNASLVRTDLTGGNRTLIASTSGVQQVAVFDNVVYYAEWNNGVYSVPVTGGTPTQIIAPSFITSSCTGATGGWGGVTVTADNLFFSWFNGNPGNTACYGVYKAAKSGSTFGAPSTLPAPGGSWTTAGQLQTDGTDLYHVQSGTSFYKTSDYTNWTSYNVSAGGFSLQSLSVYGSSIYMTANNGSVYSMPKTDTAGSSITRLFTNAASSSGYQIVAMAPPTYTVTFQHGTGASGADLVETIAQGSSITLPSPVACPLSATDPCFTAPSGQRQNGWVNLSGGPTYYSTGQTITPASNLTLTARWTGGPIQFSTTSFLTTPNPMTSIAFPNTAVGSNNQITLYAYNSGSASTSISNETVGGTGVSHQGGTCNASGGTIAAGAQCTVILQWNPSAAGALQNGSYTLQVSGGYFDAVTLTGTAATNKTVTFNANTGTGTMQNQISAFAANLNALGFAKAGYSFQYWTLFSDGSGSQYQNQSSFPFTNNQTLFAQWSADSHIVTYDTVGGSAVANGSFLSDGTLTLPAAPTRADYTFDGWFASQTGGTAVTSPYSPGVLTDITLYAQWTANPAPTPSGGGSSAAGLSNTGGSGSVLWLGGIGAVAAVAGAALIAVRRRSYDV